jgi:DUF4097 and DUF4098 domain-containing protein YvlB
MKSLIAVVLVCLYVQVDAQTQTEKITKELSFEVKNSANALIVENINGDIKVEGYSGSTIQVEVEKIINGKTAGRLQKGLQEVKLGVIDRADTIILFVDGLCTKFGRSRRGEGNGSGWSYEWRGCNHENDQHEYDYTMNFNIKVPFSTNVRVGTVNDGDVSVSKMNGKVTANNVNGHVRLADLRDAANASTINGDLDVTYAANPSSDCRFYTLNGDINAYFKKGLSSLVGFKSFNGEFYTNLTQLESVPVEVEKKSTGKGVKFKVNGNRFKTGNGGALLDFETFNGNVYLREQ